MLHFNLDYDLSVAAFYLPLSFMKIHLLAATQLELSAITFEHPSVSKRVCGVGGASLAMDLIPYISVDKFDLIILAGLAGGLPSQSKLGEVVKINTDVQGDLGAFQNGKYIPFTSMGLIENKKPSTKYNICDDVLPELTILNSLSTNTLFQEATYNALRHAHYETQIENMEGAAFQEICEEYEAPYLQLRAVSNYIGERDKSKWKLKEALQHLDWVTTAYLKSIL